MQNTIGLLAYVDAGKTTVAEQILYSTGTLKRPGRVDFGDTHLDFEEIERKRGITVFLGQAEFCYQGMEFHLLDTPGHMDFSTEMERSLAVLDYAVVIISLVEGVTGYTTYVWKLLKERKIPTIFFLNKLDREGADIDQTLSQIKKRLSKASVIFPEKILKKNKEGQQSLSQEELENFAEANDALLEYYISEENPKQEIIKKIVWEEIRSCRLFPCICGSALKQQGIDLLLELFCELKQASKPKQIEELSGIIYKIRRDEKGNRIVFLKVVSGHLSVKQEVVLRLPNGELCTEKADQIRIYSGEKYRLVETATQGQLCAVTGFTKAIIGSVLGETLSVTKFEQKPILQVRLICKDQTPIKRLLEVLYLLQEEDPMLKIEYEERLEQVKVHIMGTIQAEVLKETLEQRFKILVELGTCEVQYLETIAKPVKGYGHYEPLRHYAEVHLKLAPEKSGTGILTESHTHVDILSQNYQNQILSYLKQQEYKGRLTGSPLTDVRIQLTCGRAHLKHTEGGDFRQATDRAVYQGLCKADLILLEPIYQVQITVPSQMSGHVIADIKKRYGTVTQLDLGEQEVLLTGKAPVATMMDYPKEFASLVKGSGTITLTVSGYLPCHNTKEVIEKIGYNAEHDPEVISGSVFCSHGSGFYVSWQEAEAYMHCPLEEENR